MFESLNLGKAFELTRRTMPIILVRLGASILFWLVAIIYFVIVGAVAALIGSAVEFLGVLVFIIGIGGMAALYHLAYRYVFYMIKAAHIAIIAELLKNDKIKDSGGQLAYGKNLVQARFGEVNAMFVVDELVSGVVRGFTRTVYNIARFLPGDTLDTLITILNRVIWYATTYIDEAVLARSFYDEGEDVWTNARDGVVLYAMKWKPILKNAIALMILSFIPFILAFIVFSLPVGLLLSLISSQLAGWSLIILLLLSWLIKVAIGDTFAMIAMITTYYRETNGVEPNPEMAARLDSISDKFKELSAKAGEAFGFRKTAPATPTSPVAPSAAPSADTGDLGDLGPKPVTE
ncbi:hypothetical protein G4Y79_04215 [Phototrophicus methaneseepsis]|uniref:Uncharacterized protein n=1 Tax=Phototrophicus methaneseepsis TaxID=2710758 RepID=A0A7S8IEF3_9CHLR|nr:hypothetical protein [Phototrophicus methaneseepsis]QPC83595.1 hypothetical protein G4Y79_04215 [Phototrophicus methaneseepsis]